MSWGERSCKRRGTCKYNPTQESCNVNCLGYLWDDVTPKDSIVISDTSSTNPYQYTTGKMAEIYCPHGKESTAPADFIPERGLLIQNTRDQIIDGEGRRMNRKARREEIKKNKKRPPLNIEEQRRRLRKKRKKK